MSKFNIIDKVDERLIEELKVPTFKYMALDIETYSPSSSEPNGALDCTIAKVRLIALMTEQWDCPKVIDVKLVNNEDYIIRILSAIKEGHQDKYLLIAHNASYEYTVLYHNYHIKLEYIRDTLTAIATLDVANGWKEGRLRGKKLGEVAWHFMNVDLDKTLQVSDWGGVLSKAQYEYSSLDVGAPEGSVNPFTEVGMKSVVIEFYLLMEKVCKEELNMGQAFELDQACVPIVADMEANGVPLNIELCQVTSNTLNDIKVKSLQKLCTGLGRRLQLDLITGELIVPEDLQKLLNNNAKLLKVINGKLSQQQKLNDVQMSSLESLLKDMDSKKEEEDEEGDDADDSLVAERIEFWHTKDLIRDLLDYKKHFKVCGEVDKYLKAVRPKTNCIHGHINVVGTGTARTSSGGGVKSLNLQSIPNSYVMQEVTKSQLIGGVKTDKKYRVNTSVRTLFGKPYDSGLLWFSGDYSSQELRIASAASKDKSMLDVFYLQRDNPTLLHPETNKEYANPLCDLHIVAARKMFPFLEQVPLWELEEASTKPLEDGKVPRKVGKIVNFCVSTKAEALTKKGWRKYGEFTCDDEILTYDTKQDCYVWCKPSAINYFEDQETLLLDYKGDHNVATENSISRWSVITTPNHRWWTFLPNESSARLKGETTYGFRDSAYIMRHGVHTKMFLSSSIQDNNGNDVVEEWNDLMVMCTVMFHLDRSNKDTYVGKYLYSKEVNNLNANLGETWVLDYKPCDYKLDPKPINPLVATRLSSSELNTYRSYGHVVFDKRVVDGVFSKYGVDPFNVETWYDFIHSLDKATLDEMFCVFEDICSIHKKRIRTMSFNTKEVKDLVQLIGLLIGYTITDLESSGVPSFLYKSTKTINSCKCEGMYVHKHTNQDVWCPTTPTGTWVMRHENFIGVTGNSILYGKSDKGFSEDFGLSLDLTRMLISAYSSGFPELFKWIDEVSARAKYERTIRSMLDRVVFVFESNAKGEDSESAGVRKAVNAVIQTSGGDMMKMAMKYIKEDKELYKLLNVCSVVHDEMLVVGK